MAEAGNRAVTPPELDAESGTFGIVYARWNSNIVERLMAGATKAFSELNAGSIKELSVAGSYELPMAAKLMADTGDVEAIVALGAVIRGETTHYELVAGECGSGLMSVQLQTGVPIGFGVLTVENVGQAMARSMLDGSHNVGAEAAAVAVEMASHRRMLGVN